MFNVENVHSNVYQIRSPLSQAGFLLTTPFVPPQLLSYVIPNEYETVLSLAWGLEFAPETDDISLSLYLRLASYTYQ